MNLLLINYEYPPIGGGAANATWHLAKALNESGNSVAVLTAAYRDLRGWRQQDGIGVYRCRAWRRNQATSTISEMLSFAAGAAPAVLTITRQRRIDAAIVFFLFPCGPLGPMARALRHIPYLISLRGGDVPGTEPALWRLHQLLTPLRRLVYRYSAAVVANSEGLRDIAQRSDRVAIDVIPNGVDTDYFRPDPGGRNRRPDAFELLFVGRLQPQKNLFFLFRELAAMAGAHAPRLILHMVGKGPQEEDLKESAQRLGLAERIIWHGWLDRSQMQAMYRRVDGLVMPSRYEGMSNVILEAMASELPVLASRVGGNTDLIQDGQTGFLFDLDSSRSFQDALAKMVGKPDNSRKIGVHARQFVLGHLSWAQVANRYLEGFSKR